MGAVLARTVDDECICGAVHDTDFEKEFGDTFGGAVTRGEEQVGITCGIDPLKEDGPV